jgi:hypothetical protein
MLTGMTDKWIVSAAQLPSRDDISQTVSLTFPSFTMIFNE